MRPIKQNKLLQQVKLKVDKKSKSSYGKYRCQYKQNPILTKLSADSGYPQDILLLHDQSPESSNYIEENKQNLKNFFKERIPAQNTLLNKLMKRETEMVNPKRIFQIKQLQYELKNKTKITLKHSFDLSQRPKPTPIDKLDSNFHLNDRTKQLKEQYAGSKELFSFYDQHNYRRGTQSHIEKRSKILKKQAYDKVFGLDISALCRTAVLSRQSPVLKQSPPPRAKSISLNNTFYKTEHHTELKKLISKMHGYKNKLQDKQQVLELQEQFQSNTSCEQNMVTVIQRMAKLYQTRTISDGSYKLQSIEDLSKINHSYYEEMLSHKNNRLNKRQQLVYQASALSPAATYQAPNTHRFSLGNHSQISAHDLHSPEQEEDLLPQAQQRSVQNVKLHINEARYRFKLLKKTLVRWAALFYVYGIQKANIFMAFRTNRPPYQLQGSYAFFKCIKMGDLGAVRTFLQKDYNYVFQRDFHGKTSLSYAAMNNQLQIVHQILQVGVNSDLLCNNMHTSLYYALTKRNVEMVQEILQKGACPWSSSRNNYKVMIKQGEHSEQFEILFNNARKVYLGMQIQSTINKRKLYWHLNYHRITTNKPIRFKCS